MNSMRTFLETATRHLWRPAKSTLSEYCNGTQKSELRSWCCWTTYGQLVYKAGYWSAELPLEAELGEKYIADGGTWGQPFLYEEIAHVIIPREFTEEPWSDKVFTQWDHEQDVDGLSALLNDKGIDHHLSRYALEVKLF